MQTPRSSHILLLAFALCTVPAALRAAQPEKVGAPFEVSVTSGPGGPQVEMTFALIHSDVSTYPVTITAVAGPIEEELWKGSLPEGVYRFKGPLQKIKSGQVRLILKTRMTNIESGKNQSFNSYRRWDGQIR